MSAPQCDQPATPAGAAPIPMTLRAIAAWLESHPDARPDTVDLMGWVYNPSTIIVREYLVGTSPSCTTGRGRSVRAGTTNGVTVRSGWNGRSRRASSTGSGTRDDGEALPVALRPRSTADHGTDDRCDEALLTTASKTRRPALQDRDTVWRYASRSCAEDWPRFALGSPHRGLWGRVTATADPALGLTAQPLWPHQAAAFQATRDNRAVLIDGDMGSGKTAVAIALLEHDLRDEARPVRRRRAAHPRPYRVLVLAPKSVLGVWPNQIAEHATSGWTTWNGEVRGRNGKPLRNPSVTRRAEALVQATTNAGKLRRPFMAVVGYEASWQGDMAKLLLGTPWDAVILDESHRLKSAGGKASKHAAQIAARVRARGGRVLALTGTPMPHSPLDIWAQARALDGGAALGTSYHRFCSTFGRGDTIWAPGPRGPFSASCTRASATTGWTTSPSASGT
jgi:hypothetical protein